MCKVQHLHVKDYSIRLLLWSFFFKCKLDAGGTDEDDVLDDPVSKKPKGSSSNSKQNAGKRSRKVMTEVNIARY